MFSSYKNMTVKLLLILAVLVLAFFAFGCGQEHDRRSDAVQVNDRLKDASITPSDEFLTNASIDDVAMRFWWWEEADARSGIDTTNPPEKSRYLTLTKWEYDGVGIKTYPHNVDLVATVFNPTAAKYEGSLKFIISGRFEDYEVLYSRNTETDEIEFNADHYHRLDWSKQSVAFEQNITLEPNESRSIKLENFDLTKLLNTKIGSKPLAGLRLEAILSDKSGKIAAKKETSATVLIGL